MRYITGRRLTRIVAAAIALVPVVMAGSGVAVAADRQPSTTLRPLIVGGADATQPYPPMASLQTAHGGDPNFHFCGAVLVAPRAAVTNAHCVTLRDASPVPANLLHLRIGAADRTSGGTVASVTAVVPHPAWDWATGDGPVADIAVLKLDRAVQGAWPIAPWADPDASARLLGWGLTSNDASTAPITLQQLDTRLVEPARCAAGGITAGELCVASPNGAGACYGDSGGPALQRVYGQWQIIGGASRETEPACGAGPTIYTDTTAYRTWVWTTVFKPVPIPPPGHPLVNPDGAWAKKWTAFWGR